LGNGVAIAVGASAALLALIALVIGFGAVTLLGGGPQSGGEHYAPSAEAVRDIPPQYLRLYRAAGARYGLDWTALAAVGKIECDHGRSRAVGCHRGEENPAGAAGPAQFLTGTWRRYGVDGDGDGRRDRWGPADAIFGMANYLRASGAPADYGRALYAYNHAAWYVQAVLAQAQRYRGAYLPPSSAVPDGAAAAQAVLADPRILLSDPRQRADIAAGRIDPRVLGVLLWAGADHTLVVTALRSDHPLRTSAGSVSNHAAGRAVDIGAVDGHRCIGTRRGTCGQLALRLARLIGPLHPTELIYCFDADGPASPDAFARSDHCDHLHVGYDR
jgi:hypothetical protein